MKDHLRFAVCYWHTFRGMGGDPVRPGCAVRPLGGRHRQPGHGASSASTSRSSSWRSSAHPTTASTTATSPPKAANLAETNKILDKVIAKLKEAQARTGIKLLWGTANLFSNKRFVHGASTSPNADVFAYSAAQVKKALEVTKELGGENYVFWGGREGYMTLWNTNLKRELDHLAKFFHMAVEYKRKIGFTGTFLIEPKPHEPTSHQYDFDCAHSLAFLRSYGLEKEFKFNVETNHASLAKHTMGHELEYASMNGCSAASTPTAATRCSGGTPTSSPPTCT
jgi:xylose isomerase